MSIELLTCNNFLRFNPNSAKGYIRRGMIYFKQAKIAESIQDFDRAEAINPNLTPYLWQRGLAYYYAERFEEGAKQFEIDLTVNSQDVEETVWRYLCVAAAEGVKRAKDSLLEVKNDPRPFMGRIYQLYAGHLSIENFLAAAHGEGKISNFYTYLYAGLYHEAGQDEAKAKQCILKAVSHQINDYMWHLAVVHQRLRNW